MESKTPDAANDEAQREDSFCSDEEEKDHSISILSAEMESKASVRKES